MRLDHIPRLLIPALIVGALLFAVETEGADCFAGDY
jgi:hypothetical protein